jgi:arylsulfatase A-like enzyme
MTFQVSLRATVRFAFLGLVLISSARAAEPCKTNLILILSDNHGAWTLGCYGNKEIRTPNIDRLAAEGTLFTRAYCANSVCSPSRATFLTGLIPSQHGVHSYLGPDKQNSPSGPKACVINEFDNFPKILSRASYTCGLVGKWHLGGSLQPQQGFSYWFTKPSGHTTTFYGDELIWHGKIYRETNYTTDVIANHAVEFLEQNRDRPFFLYLPFNAPYGLGAAVQRPHTNRHTAYYADKPMDSFPRAKVNPWVTGNKAAVNNVECMRSYAAAVSGLDDGIGRVMETLRRLNLDTNTLVVFSADQGMNGGHGGFWGIGDHSRPVNTHEAEVRIPLIFHQPGKVSAGKKSDLMVSNYDFLPTALDYLGLAASIPTNPALPGKSFATALAGKPVAWNDAIFHEYENTRMIRTERWKLTLRFPKGPDELYDMQNDPDEQHNLIADTAHAAEREKLRKRLQEFFAKYADPKYDLWRGGISKARRVTKDAAE